MDSGNEQRGILMFDDLIFPFPFLLFAQYIYILLEYMEQHRIEMEFFPSLLSLFLSLDGILWKYKQGTI